MAITADKIKMTFPSECVSNWKYRDNVYKSAESGLPYHLYLKRDEARREYTLEFSAKILKDRYVELITIDNIHDCLQCVNSLDFCDIDIERLLSTAQVKAVDFTKDIRLEDIPTAGNMRGLKSILKLSMKNYRRWNCQDYRGNGLVITNIVADSRYSRRLTIYDKAHELRLNRNREFLRLLDDSERLLNYFNDRVRFELRATTQHQLRRWLNTDDLAPTSVLSSTTDPIGLVMAEMFNPINAIPNGAVRELQGSTLRTQDRLALLKCLDWDLARVEAHVREHSNRSITESMKPYRDLYSLHFNISQSINIVEVVGNL